MKKSIVYIIGFLLAVSFCCGALTDNLKSHYSLNEISGNVTVDSLGIFNGTAYNTVIVSGKLGNAKNFTTSSYVNLGNQNSFGDFSFNAWINATQLPNSTSIESILTSGSGSAAVLFYIHGGYGANNLTFMTQSSGSDFAVWTDYGLSTNNWTMVTVTRSGTTVHLYINGVDSTNNVYITGSPTGTINTSSGDGNLYVGALTGGGSNFQGSIDEVGFWNRILNQTEITRLYNSGAGLTYPFNGGIANITNVNCTDCNPPFGSTTPPYTTYDTTPTFTFSTTIEAYCRISNQNISYTNMTGSRNCTGGEGTTYHTCTLTYQDELVTPTQYVYIHCITSTNESSVSLPMNITYLDVNSTRAIDNGIMASSIWPGATIYNNQKVYLRSLNGSVVTATVNRVAVYGNQRWLLHYENDTTSALGLFNITPVVYVLEMRNISLSSIRATVANYINSTKS